jgi:WD40 repeat protein
LLYDLSTGRPLKLEAEAGAIEDLAFSPHAGLIAIAYNSGSVVFWDRSGKRVRTLLTGRNRGFGAMAYSPNGRYLAIAQDERVELTELWIEPLGEYAEAVGAAAQAAEVRSGPDFVAQAQSEAQTGVHCLVAAPLHDAFACVAGLEGTLWNLEGDKVSTFSGHTGVVRAVSWSSDGQKILTGSEDKTARVWSLGGRPLAILQHDSAVMTAAFHGDSETIATGSAEGDLWLSTASRVFTQVHMERGKSIEKVAFVPAQRLVAAVQGNSIRLWDFHGIEQSVFEFAEPVSDAVFSPDGRWLLARSWLARTIWRVDLNDGNISVFKKTRNAPDSLAISPDGKWIATSDIDCFISLWNAGGEELRRIERSFRSFSLAFTRDSRHLLAGLSTGRIEAWTVPAPIEEFLETGLVELLSAEQMLTYDISESGVAAMDSGT